MKGIIYHPDRAHETFEFNRMGDALAKIGQEGWELVSCFHLPAYGILAVVGHVHYVFKRELYGM